MAKPPKSLQKQWYDILKQDGFKDAEDSKQRLKQKDSRTQSFKDQETIRIFFQDLDYYLNTQELEPLHREILQLYTEGVFITEIARRVKKYRQRVHEIISIHKKIIKSGHFPRN